MKDAKLFAQLAVQGKFEPPQEPPLFDWRDYKGTAEKIIEEVGREIRMVSIRGDRRRKGEKLAADEVAQKKIVGSLARLLAEAAEEYLNAKFYCEVMDAPSKRHRPSVAKKPMTYPKGYDYSAYQSAEETVRQNFEMLALFPKRKRGNPTKTRKGDALELGPLVPVYWLARDWWMKGTKGKFTPSFVGMDETTLAIGKDLEGANKALPGGGDYNNADARFLLMVLRSVEPKCRRSHAAQIYDRLRGSPKRRLRRGKS